ncbi:Folylpolyglutamate synthetase [Kappamyces sp. JEL0680]|nr:Folylpolyglutamate synthetase [Kappamyces sp. JEL0680]
MKTYLARIGYQPHDLNRLNLIHVAGTKGKGSTCAFTQSILAQFAINRPAGGASRIKTGLYSSPHLLEVRERIRINGEPLSQQKFAEYFFNVWDRLEAAPKVISILADLQVRARFSLQSADGDFPEKPAYFRYVTLVSFHAFLQENVDAVILEVGIGGEYDCTNVIEQPVVTGISSLVCAAWFTATADPSKSSALIFNCTHERQGLLLFPSLIKQLVKGNIALARVVFTTNEPYSSGSAGDLTNKMVDPDPTQKTQHELKAIFEKLAVEHGLACDAAQFYVAKRSLHLIGAALTVFKDTSIFCIFVVFGISQLIGWNTWIQLHAHFEQRLVGSSFLGNFELWISFAFQIINLASLVGLLKWQPDPQLRISGGLGASCLIFALALLLQLAPFLDGTAYFSCILVLVCLSSASGALLSAMIGEASSFSPLGMVSMNTGQGLSGLLVTGVAALTKSIYAFFSTAILITLLAGVANYKLFEIKGVFDYQQVESSPSDPYASLDSILDADTAGAIDIDSGAVSESESVRALFSQIHLACWGAFMNLFLSLSVFPAITSAIHSTRDTPNFITLGFFVYTIADLIGKACSYAINLPIKTTVALSFARLGFLPLFLCCNVVFLGTDGLPLTHYFPVLFGDGVYLFLLCAFAFSNGLLCSLSYVHYPSLLAQATAQKLASAGDLMQLCLTVGLTLGSLFSFLLQAASCRCNPFV